MGHYEVYNNQYLTIVAGVQTCHLDHYTSCGVGNVHAKFKGCTVDVQVATWFLKVVCNGKNDLGL